MPMIAIVLLVPLWKTKKSFTMSIPGGAAEDEHAPPNCGGSSLIGNQSKRLIGDSAEKQPVTSGEVITQQANTNPPTCPPAVVCSLVSLVSLSLAVGIMFDSDNEYLFWTDPNLLTSRMFVPYPYAPGPYCLSVSPYTC